VIARASDDDTDYIIPAGQVELIEKQRYRQLTAVAAERPADGQTSLQPSRGV
jgi:hypothetical protein